MGVQVVLLMEDSKTQLPYRSKSKWSFLPQVEGFLFLW